MSTPPACLTLSGIDVVKAVQISVWTNIFGPVVLRRWAVSGEQDESSALLIARQTLESSLQQSNDGLEFGIHGVMDLMIVSVCFDAPHNGATTKFSLSLVFPRRDIKSVSSFHPVLNDKLAFLALNLREVLRYDIEDSDIWQHFTPCLFNELDELKTLLEANFEANIDSSHLGTKGPPQELDFVARAITAHLTTSGRTVVIGTSHEIVDEMVQTLVSFLFPDQRKVCARTVTDFVSGLYVQGIVSKDGGMLITETDLLRCHKPVTIVDTESRTVSYPCLRLFPFNRFSYRETLIKILAHRVTLCPVETSPPPWTPAPDFYFMQMKPSPIVLSLLDKTLELPVYMRQGYIDHFLRTLSRKAAVLVQYVKSSPSRTHATFRKKMRDAIGIDECDENLFLLRGENINPGLSAAVEIEKIEVMRQLFDSFV